MTAGSDATRQRLAKGLRRYERPLLFVLLSLLLLVLLQGSRNGLGQTLFIAHLGVFLLWQPFIAAEQRLSALALAGVTVGIGAAAWFLTPWMLAGWLMLLGGIIGGKVLVFSSRGTRLAHLVALGMTIAALLMIAVPAAFPAVALPGEVTVLGRWLMLGGLLLILLMPYDPEPEAGTAVIDFIYSVFVFLMLAVLVLGTLAAMQLFHSSYVEALLQTVLGLGVVLMLLGWSWNPRAGVGGVGNLVSRYTLSMGVPVEQWLDTLATLAARVQDPNLFLRRACEDMVRHLRWISGGRWETGEASGDFGVGTGATASFRHGELVLTVHSRFPLSPSMVWHVNLLTQLLAEFHADKKRAIQLNRLSYMEAIHETGARLTHDIKNLLQSLNTLCAAVETPGAESSPEYQALLRRQLPAIAARLQEALDKMKAPQPGAEAGTQTLGSWWDVLRRRHADLSWLRFSAESLIDAEVPGEALDGVVDNAVRNVLDKRLLDPNLSMDIRLECVAGGVALHLCDDGRAFPAAIVDSLFTGPVVSENGLGIGLFQAARQAQMAGYRLTLAENRDGRVCLHLHPASRA